MATILNNIIFDKIVGGLVSQNEEAKAWLTQLSSLNFDVTAEEVTYTDAEGRTVYRKYRAKSLAVSATNAFIAADALGLTSGSFASREAFKAPKIVENVKLDAGTITLADGAVDGEIKVYGLSSTDIIVKNYEASDFSFAAETHKLTLPTASAEDKAAGVEKFMVKYMCAVEAGKGTKIVNDGEKFGKTCELIFKGLAVDPCDHRLRAAYITVDRAMPDPNTSFAINSGENSTMDIKFNGMISPCDDEKILYSITFVDDDFEEEE